MPLCHEAAEPITTGTIFLEPRFVGVPTRVLKVGPNFSKTCLQMAWVARNLVAGFAVFGVACGTASNPETGVNVRVGRSRHGSATTRNSSGFTTARGAMPPAVICLADFLPAHSEEEKAHV